MPRKLRNSKRVNRKSRRVNRKSRRVIRKSRKSRKLLKGGSGSLQQRFNALRNLTPKEAELKLKFKVMAKQAETLGKKGEKDEALEKYTELVEFMLSEIKQGTMRKEAFDKDVKDYLESAEILKKEIKLKRSFNVMAKQAETLGKKGEKDEALEKYTELVEFMLSEIKQGTMRKEAFDKDVKDYLESAEILKKEIKLKSNENQTALHNAYPDSFLSVTGQKEKNNKLIPDIDSVDYSNQPCKSIKHKDNIFINDLCEVLKKTPSKKGKVTVEENVWHKANIYLTDKVLSVTCIEALISALDTDSLSKYFKKGKFDRRPEGMAALKQVFKDHCPSGGGPSDVVSDIIWNKESMDALINWDALAVPTTFSPKAPLTIPITPTPRHIIKQPTPTAQLASPLSYGKYK
jgi:tetratricopeptide (TPR) repeat protein